MSGGQPRDGDVCAAEHDADGDHCPTLGEPGNDGLNDGGHPEKHADERQHVDRDDRCWTRTVTDPLLIDLASIACALESDWTMTTTKGTTLLLEESQWHVNHEEVSTWDRY